jgi:hypothetical protein
LRVHIAQVGFEVSRIVEPLVRLRADRAYLLTGRPGDQAAPYWKKVRQSLANDYKGIEVREKFENPWDFHGLLRVYGSIVEQERAEGNLIFVNVSTGTKISAMVGLLAGMFWGATPYYAMTGYVKESESVGDILFPPILRFNVLPEAQRLLLVALKAEARPVRKEELIAMLRGLEILPPDGELSDASVYRRLDALLLPLVQQGFLQIRGTRKAGRIELTEPGRGAALLLEPAAHQPIIP